MKNNFTKSKIAGIILIIGGVGHFVSSFLGTFKVWAGVLSEGWWNKIPPPWTSPEITLQKAFWVTWGSFALPLLILGSLILWLAGKEIKVPKFIGFGLLTYAVLTMTLLPKGGMWLFLVSAVLLLSEKSEKKQSRLNVH